MKTHLPRQYEACALALPYVGLGLNIFLTFLLPIGLMYQFIKGRYAAMGRNKGLVFSILLYAPVLSIPPFALFDYLFSWKSNLGLVVAIVMISTIISTLVCYQLLRSAETKLYTNIIKEQ